MNVLLLHYTHPEGYPPTLNAINCIANKVNQLIIIATNTLPTNWTYSKNVKLNLLKGNHDRFNHVKRSKLKKLKTYINYTWNIIKTLKKDSIDLVIIYDDVPFFLFKIASFFYKKRVKLWYHNHDVYPLSNYKKYRINWFGAVSVQRYFHQIDYFSLPALERKKMFPLTNFKGKFFFIPNYPSTRIIAPPNSSTIKKDANSIKLVYPGSPSFKNGFEELIDVIHNQVNGKTITLTIVGDTHATYQSELYNYAKNKGVEHQLYFEKRIPYVEMTHFLKQFDIGWGLYKPIDLSVATAGSSSNKIYEFLANGLPIIVFDNEHHKDHLENCKAAFFCDLSTTSILNLIETIDNNINELSKIARQEFEAKFKFETKFELAFNEVLKDLSNI